MTTPSIALRGLSKSFPVGSVGTEETGVKAVVRDVTLEIGAGDRLGIVGKNGAGKSTLLRLIAGLTDPTAGTVDVTGHVTSIMTLGVGLRDEATGRENIYLDGELQGQSRKLTGAVLDDIIAFADLGEFIDYPVRTYSTGMKARLAFSMISQINPEILIIDEALSVGDAGFSTKATARIKEICARGKIVIVVSHSMGAIREMCNRCLWMDDGVVVMDGHPDEVTEAYIESVRSADEQQLLMRFRSLIGERSHAIGWRVPSLVMLSGDSPEPRTILRAGRDTRVEMTAVVPVEAADTAVRLRITRLDGLIVFDESFAASRYKSADGGIGLALELTPLVLGAAVYRIDASLSMGGSLRAERSCVFEVQCDQPQTGGKPMLLYPVTVGPTARVEDSRRLG